MSDSQQDEQQALEQYLEEKAKQEQEQESQQKQEAEALTEYEACVLRESARVRKLIAEARRETRKNDLNE
ncbi:hypothetical protein [uncultured Psychrobacter sp.]|uniref:hypothetical protein n=1 Tax=uncultured Psychrobacter sp. TaxID=259303 RepID=UPI00345B2F55